MLANCAAGQIPALNDPVHERFGGGGYRQRSNLDTLAPRIFEKRTPSSADVEHAVAGTDIAGVHGVMKLALHRDFERLVIGLEESMGVAPNAFVEP